MFTGTDGLYAYLDKYDLSLEKNFLQMIGKHTKKPWTKFISSENQHLAVPEAVDLIDKMLVYDHQKRILPKDALKHPYFQPVLVCPNPPKP